MELLNHAHSRSALEDFCRARARTFPVAGNRAIVRVLGEPLLLVDTRDLLIAPHLAIDGFWESWVTRAVARHVQPGWQCVDVGANCGYYTVLLGGLVGPGGRVWAWEPSPALAPLLQRTVALNGLGSWVEVVAAAAADREGPLTLSASADEWESLNASVAWTHTGGTSVVVPGRTVDEVCGGGHVDFVKIDAEGAEEQVWAGMREIRRANPRLTVLMEFAAVRYADPPAFLADIVADGFPLREVAFDGSIRETSASELTDPAAETGDRMLWLSRNA